MMVIKDMGLVTQVFNDYKMAGLAGHLAIGHTRYSTTGSSSWHNAQPMYRQAGGTEFAVGHNGNLTNTEELAASMGMLPGMATSDSDLIAELVARELERRRRCRPRPGRSLGDALAAGVAAVSRGAFSLVLAERSQLVGARDPNGFRPLCLGKLDDGWVLASETPALDITGAHFVREVEPGEVLVINADGCRSFRPWPPERIQPKLCLFEFVYLARPDSRLYGQELHGARVRMGELLADQAPVTADIVVGVPDSGMPAAEGYSRRSGIPYGHGLVKNRYIGRTFINPDPGQRALGVRRKLNPLKDAITGQAAHRGRRFDRAGHDHAGHGGHAAGGGRQGDPPPHLLAAVPLAVLLRPGHRGPHRTGGGRPRSGGDLRLHRCRQPRLPVLGGIEESDRRSRRRLLRRLPHRQLPSTRPAPPLQDGARAALLGARGRRALRWPTRSAGDRGRARLRSDR